jgi:hypothetical protein
MRRLNMHSGGFDVFLLSFKRGKMRDFFAFHCSQCVPQAVPNSSTFLSHMLWPKSYPWGFTAHNKKISISRFIHAKYMH